jgi:hypothetical protein
MLDYPPPKKKCGQFVFMGTSHDRPLLRVSDQTDKSGFGESLGGVVPFGRSGAGDMKGIQ